MATPVSLRLVLDRNSLNADLTSVFTELNRSFDTATGKITSAIGRIEDRMKTFTEVFAESLKISVQQFELMNTLVGKIAGGMAAVARDAKEAAAARPVQGFDASLLDKLQQIRTVTNYGPKGIGSMVETYSGLGENDRPTRVAVTSREGVMTSVRQTEDYAASIRMQREARRAELEQKMAAGAALRERAFGHALQYADIDSQGRGAGEMSAISEAIQQRATARLLERQQSLYDQLRISHGADYVSRGGFQLRSTSYAGDEAVSQRYSRSAGLFSNAESITRNLKTGEMKREVQEMTSLAHKMWAAIAGEGSPASKALNTTLSPLRGMLAIGGQINKVFQGIGNEAIRISALIYSMRRIGRGVEEAFMGPIEYIAHSTEASRTFESSISGIAGVAGARNADAAIMRNINNTPFSLDESRQQFMAMSKVAPFARQFSGGDFSSFPQYQGVLAGLQTLNPEATSEQLNTGLGGAMLGQMRSLRGVVRIDPDQLAELVGKTKSTDFKDNPQLLMQALQQYVRIFAPAGAVEGRMNLPGVQIGHIESTIEMAMAKIGNSGIFDAVVEKLKEVADSLFKYVDSPEFQRRAEAISGMLTTILNNVSEAVLSFINGLSGKTSPLKGEDGIAAGVQDAVKTLADASYQLPAAANLAGIAMRELAGALLDVANASLRATDAMTSKNPLSEDQRAELLSKRLAEMGFGPDQQSVQKYQRPYILSGGMGTGYHTREKVIPAGSNYDLIQSIIDRSNTLSDSAIKDGMFFRYENRDLVPIKPGEVAAFGGKPTTQPVNSNLEMLRRQAVSSSDLGLLSAGFKGAPDAGENAMGKLSELIGSGALSNETREGLWQAYHKALKNDDFDSMKAAMLGVENIWRADRHIAEGGFGEAQSEKDPFIKALLFRNAMSGQSDLADVLGDYEKIPPMERGRRFGLMGLDSADRIQTLDAATKAQLAAAKQFDITGINFGGFSPNTSAADLARMASGGPTVKTDSILSMMSGRMSSGGQNAQILRASLSQAMSAYGSAQQNLANASPGERQKAAMEFQEAAQAVALYSAELQKAQNETNQFFSSFVKFGDAAQGIMENGLAKALTDIETKSKSLRDVFSAMAKDILNQFNQMVTHNIFGALFGQPNGQPGVGNGIGGVTGGAMNALSSWLSGLFGMNAGSAGTSMGSGAVAGAVGAADGGVFVGGLRLLAGGGLVKGGRGQLAIIGEGGLGADEAVVPMRGGFIPISHDSMGLHAALPGGRRIPAAMFADGGIVGGGRGPSFSSLGHGNGGGDGMSDIHVHTHLALDGKEIAHHVHTATASARRAETLAMFRPGGEGRRVASKV